MSDDNKGSSGAPEEVVSDPTQESQTQTPVSDGKQSVQYDTYRRTVGDVKKWKGKFDELETKFTDLEQRELERDGKKDELIEQLRKSKNELTTKLSSAVGNFARGKAHDFIVDEAVKMGCVSPKLLKKIVEDELQTLDYDDEFNPDKDQVKRMLEKIKNEEPILFQKAGPKLNSHIPFTGNSFERPKTDLKQTSTKDLEASLLEEESLF